MVMFAFCFSNKIFFSDQAHFPFGGYVNKRNCRIWGFENPQVIEERPLHAEKVTVWCTLWSGDVIYLLRKRRYNGCHHQFEALWSYDNRLCLPAIEEYVLENMWFQQDGARCHTTRTNMALLQEIFPDRVISFRGDSNWPLRSCDLTS